MINFITGGMTGDAIHSLYVVKNLCQLQQTKANFFISDGDGDRWLLPLDQTYSDLKELIESQPYINSFQICRNMAQFSDPYINLNDWRKHLSHDSTGYTTCWSEVLSGVYQFSPPSGSNYAWLTAPRPDPQTQGRVLIHRSKHRHNGLFPWSEILARVAAWTPGQAAYFLTCNPREYDLFCHKHPLLQPYLVSTVTDLANALASCKLFVGNQSAPFALASALDIPRAVELDTDPARFYIDETKYSSQISYFLNPQTASWTGHFA